LDVRIATVVPNRGGYMLVELMVAMVGASVLMVGLSSTIFIALKATDTSNTPTSATIEGNAALTDLLSDLEFALSITEQTANAITFTLPDRDGDSNPETIRYAWSGTPGDPLTRQYNGGAVATLTENVHVFQHDLPTPGPNLLSNANMESGTTNWQAIPGCSILSSGTAHSGSISIEAWRDNQVSNAGVRQIVTSQLLNGTPYEISAWLSKLSNQAPFDAKLQLRINSSGSGEQLFAIDPVVVPVGSWLRAKGTVTPRWSGSLLSAHWEALGVSNFKDLYIDDVVLCFSSNTRQHVNISLQVGPDARSQLHSGRQLINSPL
jgi:Carbohydrate binding domain